MILQPILCKYFNCSDIVSYGTQNGVQRLRCNDCKRIFKTEYMYRAYEAGVKDQIVDMAINGSGIRDTGRVLGIAKNTVIATLKKSPPRSSQLTHILVPDKSP